MHSADYSTRIQINVKWVQRASWGSLSISLLRYEQNKEVQRNSSRSDDGVEVLENVRLTEYDDLHNLMIKLYGSKSGQTDGR